MARGGRVVYKKSNRRKRRKPRSNGDDDDDDDDDEYVVGEDDEDEDEESESNYESDAESDEESYEFSESDEEKEIKNGRSKKGSKKVGSRKKTRVSDEEMEDLRVPKKRGRGRSRKQELRDSDYEFDDEDEEDEDFSPDDDDEFDEDEILVGSKRGVGKKGKKRGRKRKNIASPARKRRMTENSDEDDEDFVVKDRVSVGRKRKRSKIDRRKRAKRSAVDDEEVSDFLASDDEDDEVDFVGKSIVVMKKNNKKNVKKTVRSKGRRKKRLAEDSESSDSDYVVSDDFVEKSSVVVNNKKKAKKTSGSKGRRKKKSVEISESSDSDYVISDDDDVDFDANDKIVLDKRQKKNEKENNVVVSSNRRKGRKSSVDSESSDSDYLMSDEDEQEEEEDEEEADEEEEEDDFIVKDKFLIDKQHKKTSNTRKKRTEPKTRRKRSSSLVDSDLDFDKETSEEAVKDLRVGWNFDWLKPKRPVMKKKEEEEGKEKKIDSGKQVCGICLSEEQNGIVRGLLDCCSHYFCFACIMEWSKVESRCPVCKRRFVTITKSGKLNPASGIRNTVIRVQMKDQVYQPSEEELRGMLDPYENVVCMECQQGGDDNLMLLCDICDSSAHTYCVGLGREVPEGNWYCECCRPINEGLPHSHPQDTVTDEGANPSYLYSSVTVRSRSNNARVDTNSPRPVSSSGRPPSLRIDLNASPRDLPGDDNYVASPMSGSGASTLSGRRHIHQRIRILISSSRQRQSAMRTSVLGPGAEANVVTPENAQTEEALPSVLEFEDWQQNHRASLHSNASLAPCMFNEGSSFRHVEGAKEEVQSLVKRHLKKLARDMTLELTTLKEIVKNSTHTILAACGINHHRNNVPISIDPPEYCPHGSDDGPTHLVKNCCASCFDSFVEDVVQRQVNISR